ncbi:hypothetical protein GF386_01115 [Candidatus Pacearchaeota archaeon]|nr:hypothetical protein [Candidatus Pacearchaeota archaeon]MBD3282831.1 hypothetical protein [Candidatus Pacearchaeota archaeon]
MDFDSVIRKRASNRNFGLKKPKIEKIMELIETANTAPSPGNLQILKYLLIEDEEKIAKIAKACRQEWIKKAPWVVIVCSESSKVDIMYDERAPKYIKHHVGAAVENLLLKITNEGLACCWVGAFSEITLRNALNIPESAEIEVVLPIGYPSKIHKANQKPKPHLYTRVYFETYGNSFKEDYRKIWTD